jgi:outer membrane protein assembly factor BamB
MTTPSTDDRSLLIIGIKGHAIALDRATGGERWRARLEESWGGSPVEFLVSGGVVYATGSSQDVYWLDYATGRELRRAQTTASGGRATMVLDGDVLIVARAGSIDCFSADGAKRWHNGLQGLGQSSVSLGFPDNVRQGDKDSR